MATHPRSLSSLMANHLRLPKHLITETAIYLPISGRLNLYGLKLTFIEKLLLLFFTIFNGYFYLQVIFMRWLARPKRRQIFYNYSLCLINLWFSNQFNCGLNDLLLFLVLGVVYTGLLTCVVRLNSSDPFIESCNSYSEFLRSTFNGADDERSVWGSYELKRDSSHLTSDLQGRKIEVDGETVSGYKTPIIKSDKPNRELSNETAQTTDLFSLPNVLLTEIFRKLPAFHDLASCFAVSKAWRRACLNMIWSLYAPHPWSIYFQDQNILNHLDDGRYVLERWEIDGRYYYGCVNGWILNIGSANIHIFNLFSRTETNLPILSPVGYLSITKPSDWYSYIQKFILFKACYGDKLQFLVVALFGPRSFIAFTGPQFQDWICIQSDDIARCRDVVLFEEQFYALCDRGKLVLCAFDRSNPCVSLVSQEPAGSYRADRYYLVKNVEHFIAVFQNGKVNYGGKRFGTITFSTYKFDDTMNWTHIREPDYLKGRAIFISSGNSWIIDPVTVENCKTNSIYFADEYWFKKNGDGHFVGLFDIGERKIEDFLFDTDQYRPNDWSPFSLTYNDDDDDA